MASKRVYCHGPADGAGGTEWLCLAPSSRWVVNQAQSSGGPTVPVCPVLAPAAFPEGQQCTHVHPPQGDSGDHPDGVTRPSQAPRSPVGLLEGAWLCSRTRGGVGQGLLGTPSDLGELQAALGSGQHPKTSKGLAVAP